MPNAAASYIIAAQDKTQGAVASVRRGFDNIDKSARNLAKGMKAFGVGALALKTWASMARLGDSAIQNLANSNAQFADSLRETEAAMKSTWMAGEQTIKTQETLATILKDPGVQESVSGLADRFGQLRIEMKALLPAWDMILRHGTDTKRVFDSLANIEMRGPQGRGSQRDLGDMDAAKTLGNSQNKAFDERIKAEAKAAADARKKAAEDEEKSLDAFAKGLVRREELAREYRDSVIDGATADKMFGEMQRNLLDEENGSLRQSLDDFADAGIDTVGRILDEAERAQNALTIYADQAARNMQDAFADFLFDPFENGLKGMLKGFLDLIRRMVAETAAEQIFGSKKSGGLGLGDLITTGVKSLFGFASGGSFNVGGSGGTDSQLVAFKATPGERVSVQTPAQQGRGGRSIVVTQHVTVNAAQLTQDQAARMVADSQRRMWDDLDRRYGIA